MFPMFVSIMHFLCWVGLVCLKIVWAFRGCCIMFGLTVMDCIMFGLRVVVGILTIALFYVWFDRDGLH